jgi:hypothetical protein
MSRAIPLRPIWAFGACYRAKNLKKSDRKLCFGWNIMPHHLFLKFCITSDLGSSLFHFTSFSSLCVTLIPYSCCLIYATSVTRIQVTAYPSVTNKLSTYERLLPAFGTDEQICTFVFFNSVLTQFNCQYFWRCHIVIAMTIALDIVYRLRQISSAFWRTDFSPASSEKLRGKSALNGPCYWYLKTETAILQSGGF